MWRILAPRISWRVQILTGARLSPSCPTLCTHTSLAASLPPSVAAVAAVAVAAGGGSPLFGRAGRRAGRPARPYSAVAAICSTNARTGQVAE